MNSFTSFSQKQTNSEIPEVWDVPPDEVLALKDQIVVVDVRRPDEYDGELGHIASSQLIVLDTLPHELDSLPKDKTIVFVCRSGSRSARATAFAQSKGFQSVFNMKGGMLLWNQLQLPVE